MSNQNYNPEIPRDQWCQPDPPDSQGECIATNDKLLTPEQVAEFIPRSPRWLKENLGHLGIWLNGRHGEMSWRHSDIQAYIRNLKMVGKKVA